MDHSLAAISQLMFRVPERLHERLEREAEANHRSLNAEVVARLEASFARAGAEEGLILGKGPAGTTAMQERMKRMEELVEQSTTATDA